MSSTRAAVVRFSSGPGSTMALPAARRTRRSASPHREAMTHWLTHMPRIAATQHSPNAGDLQYTSENLGRRAGYAERNA